MLYNTHNSALCALSSGAPGGVGFPAPLLFRVFDQYSSLFLSFQFLQVTISIMIVS